jgi:hypothetical protein
MKFHLALAVLALFSLLAVDAVDHGRSLKQVEVFKVEIGDKLPDNFLISSNQLECYCTCGQFAAEVLLGVDLLPCQDNLTMIDDIGNDDDDFFVTSYDGSGGSNFLTSTSTLPLCPSTVTFDYIFNFLDTFDFEPTYNESLAMTLEVIDTSAMNKVVFAVDIPNGTLAAYSKPPTVGFPSPANRTGSENITLGGVGFTACAENLRLRFQWYIPRYTQGQTQYLLDNLVVTPDPDAVSTRLESKQDACKTTVAPIDQSALSPIQYSHPVPSGTLSA